MNETGKIFIAGEWTGGASTIENRNPSDVTDLIGHYGQADRAQLDAAQTQSEFAAAELRRYADLVKTGAEPAEQLALKRTIGENILRTGYCVTPKLVKPELHPEQGTVWEWIYENDEEIYGQFSAAYNRPGAGALRKLDDRSMEELHRIFDVTGGKEFFDTIERHSDRKAREMGYDGADDEYMMDTYTKNSNEHY